MKKIFKLTGKILAAFLLTVFIYWLVISFPQIFFKSEQFENLYIYHHGNADSGAVGNRTLMKIKASGLYQQNTIYRVFITDSETEHAFFTSFWSGSFGVYLLFANGNIFLRPSLIEQDRLIKPDGNLVSEDRPLNYFIAHEVTHQMEYEYLGFSKYLALNVWIREGIADKIGRDRFDFPEMLDKYKSSAREMNPALSGLYLKYQLLVEYTLRDKNFDINLLLEANPVESQVEAKLANLIN